LDGHARAAQNPCAAHLAGDALDRGALGPVNAMNSLLMVACADSRQSRMKAL
jgi:hypothetical protein